MLDQGVLENYHQNVIHPQVVVTAVDIDGAQNDGVNRSFADDEMYQQFH